jgi:sigma-B regulation protein RsbU (phosphoserine phosphatase)
MLNTYLRWHVVSSGEGIIGCVWRDLASQMVRGDDPQMPPHACASLMIAPLIFSGQFLGVLYLTRRDRSEPFLQTNFSVFRSVAEQAAFALYSSSIFHEAAEKRRIDEDLAVAHEIQRILLPTNAPDINGYQIAGMNVPARQVSGDYYDYVEVDATHCGVAIADVSGKGVPASLIMAMCRSVLRTQAAGQLSPAKVLHAVNAQLYPDIKEDMFISMAYAILDRETSTVTLCRAGHDAPLLYRAKDRSISRINPPGMALGIDSGNVFNRVTNDFSVVLEPDDCLILYTDGITEALDGVGDEFGMQRVIESVVGSAPEGAAEIITRLTDDVRAFIGAHPQHDDITLIAIRKK